MDSRNTSFCPVKLQIEAWSMHMSVCVYITVALHTTEQCLLLTWSKMASAIMGNEVYTTL